MRSLILLLAASLPAQVVHIANHGSTPYEGWTRLAVDKAPPFRSGWRFRPGSMDDLEVQYVVGRQVGLDNRIVDVWCRLGAGQRLDVDLATLSKVERPVTQLPTDPIGWFGGVPVVNGTPLGFVSLQTDGAALSAHFRSRFGRMMVCDLWLCWYPAQPWCRGEVLLTCSNPSVPDMVEPLQQVTIGFGDALPLVLGAASPGVVAQPTTWGDGQARAVPVTFVWLRNLNPTHSSSQLDSILTAATFSLGAIGTDRLWPTGNPRYPAGFDPLAWARSVLPKWWSDLHAWPSTGGPAPDSTVTGSQDFDQVFVRGESLLAGGAGAEIGAYLGALKMANRPCHHREADGSPLDPSLHTQKPLIFWHGRPHSGLWNVVDRLGKPRALTIAEANGWQGPDVEHWLMNTLTAGARITGSSALQELMRAQARVYMLQQTTTPGWSTSQPYASRAVGYEGINAVQLWRNLEDRALAQQVRSHYELRWNSIIRPSLAGKIWWPDGFYGQGKVSPWQQALGAYGTWLAGKEFALQDAQDIAITGARAVCDKGFVLNQATGRYTSLSTLLLPNGDPDPIADNTFYLFGMPMAAWLCRSEPRGGAIWAQMLQDASLPKHFQWLPPGQ